MNVLKYPCWRFHRTEAPRLCPTPEAELALGPGWADTPAAFLESAPVSDAPLKEAITAGAQAMADAIDAQALEDLLRDTVPAMSEPVPLEQLAGAVVTIEGQPGTYVLDEPVPPVDSRSVQKRKAAQKAGRK